MSTGTKIEHCWIDCDPGLDDTFALLLASFTKTIKIIGVSTVGGNQTIEKVTSNTLTVLNLFGQVGQETGQPILKYPVLKGCSKPLLKPLIVCSEVHGDSGLGTLNPVEIPKPHANIYKHVDELNKTGIHFTTLIYDRFKAAEKQVTVIALGPLTNIALIIINHPDVLQYIDKIVLMGGAIGTGNTNPVAEFNINSDAEAASFVFESGLPIYMVPLEVTHMAVITGEVINSIDSLNSKLTNILAEFLKYYDYACNSMFGKPAHLHDPCAVAFVIDPSLFEYKLIRVDVETHSSLSYGQTVCDVFNRSVKPRNVHVCVKMNVSKFWSMMVDAIKQCDQISPANK